MDFEEQENGNLEYENENGIYTLVNMGNYVGHRSREWYETSPDCWRLMFYESKDGQIKIEALVDGTGNYSRILVTKGNTKRVLLLNYGYVDEDRIMELKSNDVPFPSKTYISFDDQYREKTHPSLKDYFAKQHEFKTRSGEVYSGDLSLDTHIINFFTANTELLKKLGEQKENNIPKR